MRQLAWVWLLAVVAAAGAEEPLFVTVWSEPEQFAFEGLNTFTSRQIADALSGDVDFLLATQPRASFAEMLRMLQQKLTLGYRHVGCPQAAVAARWDETAQQVVVKIQEGPRYRAGAVRIEGAKQADVHKLTAWITAKEVAKPEQPAGKEKGEKKEEEKDPLQWKVGEPVTFISWAWSKFEKRVKSGLAAQGFHFPKFSVEVSPDADEAHATLVVKIANEGPLATIGEIDISGSDRYSTDEILEYLGLRTPLGFDGDLQARITEKLRDSARFLYHKVDLTPPDAEDGAMKMVIKLRDVPGVSPLGAELTREERALLKFAKWFDEWSSRDEDLVVSAEGPANFPQVPWNGKLEIEFTLSLRQGCVMCCKASGEAGAPDLEYIAVIAADEISLASVARRACLRVPIDLKRDTVPVLNLHVCGLESTSAKGKNISLQFHAAVKHDSTADAPVAQIETRFDAGAAIYGAHEDAQLVFDGPVLRITDKYQATLEIEESTGRLLKYDLAHDPELGICTTLRMQRDAFRARRAELQDQLARCTNGWQPTAALSSLSRFALDEYQHIRGEKLTAEERSRLDVVKKLTERACRGGDAWLAEGDWFAKDDSFQLPPPENAAGGNWLKIAAGPLIKAANLCFPRESPPWTLTRETGFLLAGKGAFAQHEINAVLSSPTSGPLMGLYGSGLFKYVNGDLSRRFAWQGAHRTDVRFLRRDLQWLLSPQCAIRAPLVDAAETLAGLTPQEIAALTSLLTADEAQRAAVTAALALPSADSHQPADALPAMLEGLWEAALKQKVERWLQLLSQSGETRNAGIHWPHSNQTALEVARRN